MLLQHQKEYCKQKMKSWHLPTWQCCRVLREGCVVGTKHSNAPDKGPLVPGLHPVPSAPISAREGPMLCSLAAFTPAGTVSLRGLCSQWFHTTGFIQHLNCNIFFRSSLFSCQFHSFPAATGGGISCNACSRAAPALLLSGAVGKGNLSGMAAHCSTYLPLD